MSTDKTDDADWRAAANEGRSGLNELFQQHRNRLKRMVRLRMDRRLQGRIDPSDVIQEAFLEASERLGQYQRNPPMPLFLWLRFITGQRLLWLHRKHLGVQARDARREVSLYHAPLPEATSAALAAQLVGKRTSPSEALHRAELALRLREALDSMDEVDREVLSLRHFEHLTNAEAALELGIQESAASKRYTRALRRLRDALAGSAGGAELLG